MFRFGISLIVIGGILGYQAYQEGRLTSAASAQPVEIKLKDLIRRGPEGNPYVILTDYALCDNFVYAAKQSDQQWTRVWVPIVPSEGDKVAPGQENRPNNVRAILFSNQVRNQNEVESRLEKPKLTALVTNKVMSLEAPEKEFLKQHYPETNFSRCLILEEGRSPAGAGKLILFVVGAAVTLPAGIGLLVYALRKNKVEYY